jgi:hypothetical protein
MNNQSQPSFTQHPSAVYTGTEDTKRNIVMPMWHKEGKQRMVETSKQKTQIQAHDKITESATQTHTQNKQKTTCTGYDTGGDRPPGRSWLKALCPGPRRRLWVHHHSCYHGCGYTIIRAIRHEARSSRLAALAMAAAEQQLDLYPKT